MRCPPEWAGATENLLERRRVFTEPSQKRLGCHEAGGSDSSAGRSASAAARAATRVSGGRSRLRGGSGRGGGGGGEPGFRRMIRKRSTPSAIFSEWSSRSSVSFFSVSNWKRWYAASGR